MQEPERIHPTIAFLAALLFVAMLPVGSLAHAVELVTYPAPVGADLAADFEVRVEGQPVDVYDSKVAAFTYFSFDGKVTVSVTPRREFKRVDIRPKSFGIQPRVEGRTVTFQLDRPRNISVELDGDIARPLLLFGNPLENDAPQPDDPGVHYFKAGKIHEVGEIRLESNETIYIEGGAILRATVRAHDAKNVRILGRGMIDATGRKSKTHLVKLVGCRNVRLEGILALNSWSWNLVPVGCEDVSFQNVKTVSWRANDDGIDVVSSRNVTIENCFFRNNDDCIAVKAHHPHGDVDGVRVRNCVFWNGRPGNALEIGFDLRSKSVKNVVFRDCDVIHVESGGAMTIHNGDTATVANVRFENIRVEDVRRRLIELRVGLSIWSVDSPPEWKAFSYPGYQWRGSWVPLKPEELPRYAARRGRIRNVVFENIQVSGEQLPKSLLLGYDKDHAVEDVLIKNLTFNGQPIRSAEEARLEAGNTKRIEFVGP